MQRFLGKIFISYCSNIGWELRLESDYLFIVYLQVSLLTEKIFAITTTTTATTTSTTTTVTTTTATTTSTTTTVTTTTAKTTVTTTVQQQH